MSRILGRPLVRTWIGVVLISFSGVFVRLANTAPARAALLRCAYALPFLIPLALLANRRAGRPMRRALFPLALFAGGLLGADLLAWHRSIGIIGVGLATVLPNLQVVIVGIVGILLFRERPGKGFWLALPVVLAGVWLLAVFGRPIHAGGVVLVGVLLGVLTAGFYSGYLVLLRVARLKRPELGAFETMAAATLGGALVAGTFAGFEGVCGPAPTLQANLWLLALAIGSQVVGWVLLSSSIHRIPAALTSVALLLQPVLAMIWGAAIFREPLGVPQVGGALVILCGVAMAHRAVVRGARPPSSAPAS